MTITIKRILFIILGTLAGLGGWGMQELIMAGYSQSYLGLNLLYGLSVGLCFGFLFGGLDGIAIGEKKKALLSGLIGAAVGAAGGALSFFVAGILMTAVSTGINAGFDATISVLLPLSRVLAWVIIGLALGVADGLRSLSLRRIAVGGFGGLVGGLLGGLALEGCLALFASASLARVLGFVLLGLLIGLCLGQFEVWFAYGRLKVLSGALKNREFLLSRRRTTIGSGWNSDVWLHDCPEVTPRHATLQRRQRETSLAPREAGLLLLNDDSLTSIRELKYEDVIQVGSAKLLYLPL